MGLPAFSILPVLLVLIIVVVGAAGLARWNGRRLAAKHASQAQAIADVMVKLSVNAELTRHVLEAATIGELESSEGEIRARQDELFGDDFANLLARVNVRRRELRKGTHTAV